MLNDMLEALKHMLWPTRCASCEILIENPGELVCSDCAHSIEDAPGIKPPEDVDDVCALFIYDGAVKSMIAKWKYHEDYTAQHAILSFLPSQLDRLKAFIPDNTCIIPVPPHPQRLQERGFDPVWTFGTKLTKLLLDADMHVTFKDDVLIRTRHTPHQASLSHDERLHNLDGAFKIIKDFQAEKIILLDDVITTGATGSVCAKTLRNEAGAKWIGMIALAHPVKS